MSLESKAQAIEERMATQWAAVEPTVPVLYDNASPKPPSASNYVRFTVIFGASDKIDLARGRYRHVGLVTVQIFTPVLGGSRQTYVLADKVMAIWRGVQFSSITFRAPEIVRLGDRQDGWFQVNVNIPFFWDDSF